ncbi:PIN domain-containing protein [Candidatus Bathyarchaeota archaeon]|nr:PIN domain-containing protein [Candidatus Bathyarchaeota archaeon]MBS7628623.1 PIN domain-containing protein [Candidatus Bathyarchaeota archaeon]MBS7631837.1 PIN domain-containing protein [Candidatus Bathyarchaeota archaeon]
MKVLDSDILIALLRNDRASIEKLRELSESRDIITTTIFNGQEILFGALMTDEVDRSLKPAKELADSLEILCYEKEDMMQTIKILAFLEKRGSHISLIDEMIAGICLNRRATIVTRNVKHFSRIPGLKVEEW